MPEVFRYGTRPSNFTDVYPAEGPVLRGTIAMLHGGWWRSRFDRHLMDGLSQSLSRDGWRVGNVEFRRTGVQDPDDEGGWPQTFEDITTLERGDVQKVLREINNDDLALALKGGSDDIKEFIYANLSERAVETLKEDLQFMGPSRLSAVEEAQQRIVSTIRMLDEKGEVYLRRGEQDAIIS